MNMRLVWGGVMAGLQKNPGLLLSVKKFEVKPLSQLPFVLNSI